MRKLIEMYEDKSDKLIGEYGFGATMTLLVPFRVLPKILHQRSLECHRQADAPWGDAENDVKVSLLALSDPKYTYRACVRKSLWGWPMTLQSSQTIMCIS